MDSFCAIPIFGETPPAEKGSSVSVCRFWVPSAIGGLFFQNQTSFICACITWPRNCPMADRIASIICPWLTAPCVAISVDMDLRSKVASASPKSCTCDPPPKRTGLGYLWFHSNNGLGGKYVLQVSCVQRELLTRY